MKKYSIITLIVLIIIFGTIIAFMSAPEEKKESKVSIPQDKILYFYSDACSYCIKQKPILEELETEGVKFEYMDVAANPEYYTEYQVSGIPTFIFKEINNKRVGYQEKEVLKKFWEENK